MPMTMLSMGPRTYLSRLAMLVGAAFFCNVVFLLVVVPKYAENHHREELQSSTNMIRSIGFDKDSPNHIPQIVQDFSFDKKHKCPEVSNFLAGAIEVNLERAENNYWVESNTSRTSAKSATDLGQYFVIPANDAHELQSANILHTPLYCKSSLTIAFIIPFRDREPHLRVLLGHLVPILRRQLVSYTVFVVEQEGNETFNKGRLMNSGFEVAHMIGEKLRRKYDCYIFQDVDLLPERDDLLFRCSPGPYVDHLSHAINKFNYKPLCCGMTVGGVLAFKGEKFREVNGFSNSYWGWGGEDDDMNVRIRKHALKILRPHPDIGRFSMIKHRRDDSNPQNIKVFKELSNSWSSSENDGLVDLDTEVKEFHIYSLFTKVFIDVKVPEYMKSNYSVKDEKKADAKV